MSNAKNKQVNLRKEHILRKSSINLWIPMLLIAHAAVGTMIKTENKEQSENMQHIVTESNQSKHLFIVRGICINMRMFKKNRNKNEKYCNF